ncbi:hypothetical protein ACUH7Y_25105 [Clostridium beijerinckii]|uniref:Uncharacterized protein n=1 Tax=Clostridium beijerinckii TaxID=1520 RepID=A0A1S8SAG2_CLOBE|nr:hypothetical protein [Clostridium beijerinckii]NRY60859.1 hypothetical protein [Clostridium beijerinckii]OOM62302.1 hypothetical protein CLBCK_18400 [Clostridium beijerinckii]
MIYNIAPLIDGGSTGIIEESEVLIGTDIKFLSKYIDEENVKEFIKILASGTKKYIFIYARGYSEITGEYFNKIVFANMRMFIEYLIYIYYQKIKKENK